MTTLTLGPLAQIARTVRDIKESEAWYGATLGLPHLYTFGSLAFFDCGGTRLMLSAQEKPAPESILYLRVVDARTAYDLLRSRGVEFMDRSEEHTSELQSQSNLVCRLLLEKKKNIVP